MDSKNKMAMRIHEMRLLREMTMEELGQAVGVRSSAVNKWEKGIVSNIPQDRIMRLAEVLRCDPVWLIGLDQESKTPDDAKIDMKVTKEEMEFLLQYRTTDLETRKHIEEMYKFFLYESRSKK